MGHRWILDVLADLKAYAGNNDLPLLAAQIEEARVIAKAEMPPVGEAATGLGEDREPRSVYDRAGERRRA